MGRDQIPKGDEQLLRLLVVDGEESICFSMDEYFTMHGYHVDTAQELGEAERLVEATVYDAVIQDLRLGPALMQYGADAFLRKPKPLSHVAQVIQGLIESPPKQAAHSA